MPLSSDVTSREHPRFSRFRLARMADGRCRARVALLWEHRGRFIGEAEAVGAASGELRCAAQACLNALAQGAPDVAFDILGVKAIRAFDANVSWSRWPSAAPPPRPAWSGPASLVRIWAELQHWRSSRPPTG